MVATLNFSSQLRSDRFTIQTRTHDDNMSDYGGDDGGEEPYADNAMEYAQTRSSAGSPTNDAGMWRTTFSRKKMS